MTTLPQRLYEIYQSQPESPAVRLLYNAQPDQALTCRDLLLGSAGYAQALAQAGIQPGEVVIWLS